MNVYWVAAAWMALALAASLISIRTGIAVALVEIVLAAVVGNLPGHSSFIVQTDFTNFLATLGSAILRSYSETADLIRSKVSRRSENCSLSF